MIGEVAVEVGALGASTWRTQASRSWRIGASSQTQPISGRVSRMKWVGSWSGQPSAGCPATAPAKLSTLFQAQQYTLR